jgi:hypothetical protein
MKDVFLDNYQSIEHGLAKSDKFNWFLNFSQMNFVKWYIFAIRATNKYHNILKSYKI